MSHILLTGVAGFIGSHLAEALLASGHQVTGVDNFDPFYPRATKEQNMAGFRNHAAFTFHEADLCETSTYEKFPIDVDVVIHLAAKAGVRPSIEAPDAYLQTNIGATQNLMNWMAAHRLKKLLFAGSSSVYGNNKKVPFSETDNVDYPISPYAYTKKAAELLIHSYHHLYDISTLCLRFFTVYGPRQRPDLAIHKFTRMILNGEAITMFGDGTTARDYTYVADTVDGIQQALAYIEKQRDPVYEIINLGNHHPVLLKDLIGHLFAITGKNTGIRQLGMQAGDVDITYADISKAGQLLGYQPKIGIEQGLRSFVIWYEAQHS